MYFEVYVFLIRVAEYSREFKLTIDTTKCIIEYKFSETVKAAIGIIIVKGIVKET